MALVFHLIQLNTLKMFHLANVLLELLNFVEQSLDLQILAVGLSGALRLKLDLPGLDLSLLLVDQFGQLLVLSE
jgi:hypothetical protein